MIDINVDECVTSVEKIVLNSKSFSHSFNSCSLLDYILTYSSIKCYKSLPSITTLEAKGRNIIKIHKTIYLNLLNLVNIDLSDNKLLKISKNFRLFKNLKSLKLDNNQISFIPSFIGELNQLELFSISKNLLSIIPTSIQDLTQLKSFYFSYNKIDNIPIEFGQLNSLNILYMDCNYFTKIPTTLFYLKKLKELSFDWLEFVSPPYYKNIKDSIGKTIITLIQRALENMLKKGILYCDFKTFIEEISSKKTENDNTEPNINDSAINSSGLNNGIKNSQFGGQSSLTLKSTYNNYMNNNKYLKIFNAIENGYYGVVKSMLEGESGYGYLTVKNIENKTPLYYSMAKNNEIMELFLSKIKEQKIELNYIYLLKAIRMRNPELVKKLVYLGANVNSIDDQGRGVFHTLFSMFNKQISKCVLIGDFLLSFNTQVNKLDNENWGPIHLAAKRGCKECLLWIISRNKKLKSEGREEFNLNLKGRHNWTPLHLTVYSLRIEETMILLEYGCDIFARNIEAHTPKQVSISNFVFSKLLSHYEFLTLNKKYFIKVINNKQIKNNEKNKRYNNSKFSNEESFLEKSNNKDDISSSCYDDNIIINNSLTISSNIKKTINSEINNIEKKELHNLKNKSEKNLKKKIKIKKGKTTTIKESNQNINAIESEISNNLYKTSSKEMLNVISKNTINNNSTNNNITIHKNGKSKNRQKLSENKSTNNKKNNTKIIKETKTNNIINSKSSNTYKSVIKDINSIVSIEHNNNLDIQKDKLLNSDSSNIDKIQSFMEIKINKLCDNNIIKNILDNIVTENPINLILLSDICNYAIANLLFNIIPSLKELLENKIIINKIYIKRELEETIKILENLEKNPKILSFQKKKNEKNAKHFSPTNQKINKKIYGDDEYEDNNMFYQNSEINNSDDIEELDNNINFDEMDNLFRNAEQNINLYNMNKNKKNDNNLKNKKINNKTEDINLKKGNILNMNVNINFKRNTINIINNINNINNPNIMNNINNNKKTVGKKEFNDNKKNNTNNRKSPILRKKENEKEKSTYK